MLDQLIIMGIYNLWLNENDHFIHSSIPTGIFSVLQRINAYRRKKCATVIVIAATAPTRWAAHARWARGVKPTNSTARPMILASTNPSFATETTTAAMAKTKFDASNTVTPRNKNAPSKYAQENIGSMTFPKITRCRFRSKPPTGAVARQKGFTTERHTFVFQAALKAAKV